MPDAVAFLRDAAALGATIGIDLTYRVSEDGQAIERTGSRLVVEIDHSVAARLAETD